MVGKIELIEEDKCYILKISLNSDDLLPFMLFHCSYIDRPREKALAQVLKYRKEFSKTYGIPLEENLT
jgi:hypothetical protein